MRGSGIYNHLCRGPVREKQQAKKESQPSILRANLKPHAQAMHDGKLTIVTFAISLQAHQERLDGIKKM